MSLFRKCRWKRSLRFWLAAVFATGVASPCLAIDYQPFDWIPAPPGTNVVLVYYDYGAHNEFNSPIAGTAKNNTHLDSYIGVARYLHYGEISGHPYVLDFILPFGALTDGKIAGKRLGDTSGVADPIASVGYWFVNQPDKKRYLSAVVFLTVPIGSYDSHRVLNLGGNRWQNDLQVDYTQGFLDKYTFDIAADRIWYGDNTRAGTGHQTLSQSATYTAYIWLSRDITPEMQRIFPGALNTSISVGYAGAFGGSQRLDGVSTGGKTHEHQIRFTYMQSISPTWQGAISLSHDVEARGQFKQNFGVLVRIAKSF
ncbi:transporter [Dyella choica]|nr:transporter [Dyella choica]